MPEEVLAHLRPSPGATLLDATVGFGGHSALLIPLLSPGGRLIAIDRDADACAAATARLRPLAEAARVRLDVVQANFCDLEGVLARLGVGRVDGVLFDFGVSSAQLDRGERGFSYREDAPLDMRMDRTQRTTAYHLVNGLSEAELAGILQSFGQERWSKRIAAFIVRRRQDHGLIGTTGELVEVIKAAVPAGARQGGPHPARRTFQALRIAVNNELGALEAALRAAAGRLVPGGRVVAISFHSLEDRIVKHVFRELAGGCTCPSDWPVCRCGAAPTLRPLVRKPQQPSPGEAATNPRARSAKLRAAVRLADPEGLSAEAVEPTASAPAAASEPSGRDNAGATVAPLWVEATPGGLAAVLAGILSVPPVAGQGVGTGVDGKAGLPSLAETLAHAEAAARGRSRPWRRPAATEGTPTSRSRAGPAPATPVLRLWKGE